MSLTFFSRRLRPLLKRFGKYFPEIPEIFEKQNDVYPFPLVFYLCPMSFTFVYFSWSEAVARRCSVIKVFLKKQSSKNSHETSVLEFTLANNKRFLSLFFPKSLLFTRLLNFLKGISHRL